MGTTADAVSAAWREAAADLGIRVDAPFRTDDSSGARVEFIALVHDFGAPNGALVTAMDAWRPYRALAESRDCFISGLNLDAYASYDRALWIDTLEDWGWTGAGPAPSWYTGVSPWYSKPTAAQEIAQQLERIFGRAIPAEGSRPFALLPLATEAEVLDFLRSVPTGVSVADLGRLAASFRGSRKPG